METKKKTRLMFEKNLIKNNKNMKIWLAYIYFEIKNKFTDNCIKILIRYLKKFSCSRKQILQLLVLQKFLKKTKLSKNEQIFGKKKKNEILETGGKNFLEYCNFILKFSRKNLSKKKLILILLIFLMFGNLKEFCFTFELIHTKIINIVTIFPNKILDFFFQILCDKKKIFFIRKHAFFMNYCFSYKFNKFENLFTPLVKKTFQKKFIKIYSKNHMGIRINNAKMNNFSKFLNIFKKKKNFRVKFIVLLNHSIEFMNIFFQIKNDLFNPGTRRNINLFQLFLLISQKSLVPKSHKINFLKIFFTWDNFIKKLNLKSIYLTPRYFYSKKQKKFNFFFSF